MELDAVYTLYTTVVSSAYLMISLEPSWVRRLNSSRWCSRTFFGPSLLPAAAVCGGQGSSHSSSNSCCGTIVSQTELKSMNRTLAKVFLPPRWERMEWSAAAMTSSVDLQRIHVGREAGFSVLRDKKPFISSGVRATGQ